MSATDSIINGSQQQLEREMESSQLIQDYLDGNLSEDQQSEFNHRFENEPEFKKEIESLERIEKELSVLGAENFASRVSQFEKEYQAENTSHTLRPVRSFNTYYAIAASIVLAAAAGYLLFMSPASSPESLYQSYYSPYEDMILERGESDAHQILLDAMNAYNSGDFETAGDQFTAYLDGNSEQTAIWLYLGIAQSETGNYENADKSFENAKKDPQFEQQAMWYNAMSYLKQGNRIKALHQLKEIRDFSNHYKGKEASDLLEELE